MPCNCILVGSTTTRAAFSNRRGPHLTYFYHLSLCVCTCADFSRRAAPAVSARLAAVEASSCTAVAERMLVAAAEANLQAALGLSISSTGAATL